MKPSVRGEGGERDFGSLLSYQCPRRELRKEKKRLRKTAKIAFAKKKSIEKVLEENKAKTLMAKGKKKRKSHGKRKRQNKKGKVIADGEVVMDAGGGAASGSQPTPPSKQPAGDAELNKFKKEAARQRAKLRKEAGGDMPSEEDAEIRRLEKKLGLNKRRKGRIATSGDEDDEREDVGAEPSDARSRTQKSRELMAKAFRADGLDYILELCDESTRAKIARGAASDDDYEEVE